MGNTAVGNEEIHDAADALSEAEPQRRPAGQSYSTYVYKVLKQVHPDLGISLQAMSIMDSMVNDIFDRFSEELRHRQDGELTAEDVEAAVLNLLPGELAKHAISEGRRAVSKFNSARALDPTDTDDDTDEDDSEDEDDSYEEQAESGSDQASADRRDLRLPDSLLHEDEFVQLFGALTISNDESVLSVVEAALEVFHTTHDIDDLKDTLRAVAGRP